MIDIWQEIYSTIKRNKLRTFLTGFAVAWGIFMLIVLLGAGNGLIHAFEQSASERAMNSIKIFPGWTSKSYDGLKEGKRVQLDNKDMDATSHYFPNHVIKAGATVWQGGVNLSFGQEYVSLNLSGVYPNHTEVEVVKLFEGRFINEIDIKERRKVIVLHKKTAEILFNKTHTEPIGQFVNAGNVVYQVVGLYNDKGDSGDSDAYIPFTTLQTIYNKGDKLNNLVMTTKNLETVEVNEAFEAHYRKVLGANHRFDPTDHSAIWIWNRFTNYLQQQKGSGMLRIAIWVIGIFTLLSGIVGVSNIMLITVKERTREFGIRKALGAKPLLITITRNKTRSLLTAFGVFWGIFMLVALIGGGQGLEDMMKKNFEGFATNSGFLVSQRTGEAYKGFRKGRWWNLESTDIDRLRSQVKEVEIITPSVARWGSKAVYEDKKYDCSVKGLYPDYLHIESQEMAYGRFINEVDIKEARKVCVIGKRIYESLFKPGEDPCGKYVRVDGIYYQVIGMSSSEGDMNIQGRASEAVTLPFTTMQQTYNLGGRIDVICFTAKHGVKVSEIQPKMEQVIKAAHYISPDDKQAVMCLNAEAMFSMVDNLFTGINILVWMVGLGTLLAGAIGVSNIMMVTVKERTTEIGIRRAIGARPKDILQQILSESMVLTTIAGMCGISFAVMVLQLVEMGANADGGDTRFQVTFGLAIGTCALLIALGMLAGLAPAYRAMAIKPIEAIRDE